MKIPFFENGMWAYEGEDEENLTLIEIELNHRKAAEMAIENVKFQADDDYFDAFFEI